ncbi:MAG: hypothetical protein EBT08_11975, partial [Betaproteobacteria bacterium]|nr:hypothetical protein [Betaproteobacteria bacterium]
HWDEAFQAGAGAVWANRFNPASLARECSGVRSHWADFFATLGDLGPDALDAYAERLSRALRDDDVTYTDSDDLGGPARPWALNLFPFIVSAADWAQIEAGVRQRARLAELIVADAYGPQRLLREGLLPSALVTGHPGWLRPLQGLRPPGGIWLPIIAMDLAHDSDGRWWVVSQRTQSPAGLGYLLENRVIVSGQFPDAFRTLRVQRLAASYRALMRALINRSPMGEDSRVVLLTPGPVHETWFEHAYLARYLGITLVEGGDLTIRGDRVFLKTLKGLEPVHVILRLLDDDWCDPLELRTDSALGVPGLVQAMRAGQVLVANAPGSGFIESPALLGFLPAISQRLTGEALSLPSAPTWWCGEAAARADLERGLGNTWIKPTVPSGFGGRRQDAISAARLDAAALAQWRERLAREGGDWTAQRAIPLSMTPTWESGCVVPRAAMLRVFALSDGAGSWQVLPGGLARLARTESDSVSIQLGGSSADVWVMTEGEVDHSTMLPGQIGLDDVTRWRRPVASRAGENLFWLGRYTERAELATRLVRLGLSLSDSVEATPAALRRAIIRITVELGLMDAPAETDWMGDSVPPVGRTRESPGHGLGEASAGSPNDSGPTQGQSQLQIQPPSPESSTDRMTGRPGRVGLPEAGTPIGQMAGALILAMRDSAAHTSVAYDLAAMRRTAGELRDRLSPAHWRMICDACDRFAADCAQADLTSEVGGVRARDASLRQAMVRLETLLTAITGAQADRMTRDDGWRLLSIGRQIERLATLTTVLEFALEAGALQHEAGFDFVLDAFDSSITYRSRYQRRFGLASLVDTLVLDVDNPRALAWVARTLAGRLARLPAPARDVDPAALAALVPDVEHWAL